MVKTKMFGPMIFVFSFMSALIGLSAIPTNAQTTKWVDQTSGSDSNDGNTETTAYATLQNAIDNSTSGTAATQSLINVKDGTYGVSGGQTNADHCGSGGFLTAILIDGLDYLTIQAVPGHEPVVKPDTAADIVSITIENSDHLIIDNIDSDQTIAQFDNWHVCNSDDLTVRNSLFEGGEDGIDFNTDLTTALIEDNHFTGIFPTASGDEVLDFTDGSYSDVVIQDNLFENNYRQITISPPGGDTASDFIIRRNIMDGTTSQEAVRLIGADDVTLENNVIMNSTQQGLYIDTGSTNINTRHNSFFNNGEEEIRTKESGADIIIENNIIYANGTSAAISANTSSLPGEDFNLIFNDGTDTESSQTAITTFGASTITGLDPLFVSTTPGSEDLHLTVGSPAIEAGTDLGVTDDIEKGGRPRPTGTDPDIGAYEFGSVPVNHFLSYEVNRTGRTPGFESLEVTLTDQFELKVFKVKKPVRLYNPADKNDEGITDSETHLVGYEIKRAKGFLKHEKQTNIEVVNQFGTIFVDTKKPDLLLVPSLKDLNDPIEDVPDDFPVDHFKCYTVKVTKGTPKFEPTQVTLADQFEDKLFDVKKPKRLCNPVKKQVGAEPPVEIKNPEGHLMCYEVRRARGEPRHRRVRRIHVNNQFGPLQLDTVKEKELCVPSEKIIE